MIMRRFLMRKKSQVAITVTPLPLENGKFAVLLDNVLTPEECCDWAALPEQHRGYEVAVVNAGGNRSYYDPEYRNGDRCIVDDENLSQLLFDRIEQYLPSNVERPLHRRDRQHSENHRTLVGLNERLRFLRYNKGGFFRPHSDGIYQRPDGSAVSSLTAMLYLNDGEIDFQGGRTCLLKEAKSFQEERTVVYPVVPKPGRMLVFDHDILHVGEEVTGGTKLCVRTDVMFHTI